MRSISLFCLLVGALVLPATAADGKQNNAAKSDKPKVRVAFDPKRNETTVSLNEVSLVEDPDHTMNTRALTTSFAFPGDTITTPKLVIISVLSSSTTGYVFDKHRELSFVVDKEPLDLGNMELLNNRQYLAGSFHVSAEQVYRYIPYADFLRIANAKKVKIQLAGTDYDLSSKYLKQLQQFADLMLQVGTKP